MKEYVEERSGGFYLSGSRVALDSVVHPFKSGASPESILRSFPMIGSLEAVYGALTFYLANRERVEVYLSEQESLWEKARLQQPQLPPSLARKLAAAKAGRGRKQNEGPLPGG